MSNDHAVDIDRHVKTYVMVFVALMVLTVLTVAAAQFLHLSLAATIGVALLIASVKGALVACFFMHLISERKLIYAVLVLTVVFFLVLLVVPMATELDKVGG